MSVSEYDSSLMEDDSEILNLKNRYDDTVTNKKHVTFE